MKQKLLILLYCLSIIFTTNAQTLSSAPTITFTNNSGIGTDNIATDGDGGSVNITDIDINIFNISDIFGTSTTPLSWEGNFFFSTVLFTGITRNVYGGAKGMSIKSANGNEFDLNQFVYFNREESNNFTNTVKGYRNGTEVASTTFNGYSNTYTPMTIVLNSAFNNVDEVRFYISSIGYIPMGLATNHSINSIKVSTPIPAVITTAGTTTAFSSCAGTVSAAQSFTVAGTGLTANIRVTAPTGFEVSTTAGSGYGAFVNLIQTSGIVNTTNIYTRLSITATGAPSGNVACTSTWATTKNVAVSGTVNALPTLTQSASPEICAGSTSFSIPYTATTNTPTTYSISGAGITSINNATLPTSPIIVNLSSAASGSTYSYTLTVGNANTCLSDDITGSVTVNASTLAAAAQTATQSITNNFITAAGCTLIANVLPNGAAPVSGNVTAKVWIEATQPVQFVKRHYEITSATNTANATAKVTLYFTDAEFSAFNTQTTPPALLLPISTDAPATITARKANLRIEKRAGTGDANGTLNSYLGAITTIDPADGMLQLTYGK
jgi:hypothetical protein